MAFLSSTPVKYLIAAIIGFIIGICTVAGVSEQAFDIFWNDLGQQIFEDDKDYTPALPEFDLTGSHVQS